MGVFGKKQKVCVEEFCRQFYDDVVLHPVIGEQGSNEDWCARILHSIVEADRSFAAVDRSVFRREMTALHIELFGLAWLYRFKHNRFTIPQSIFTRQYLQTNGKLEIWDSMAEYNKVVSESTFPTPTSIEMHTKLGKQMQQGIERSKTTFVRTFRWEVFKKWADANVADPSAPTEEELKLGSCVFQVMGRLLADIRKNDCMLAKALVMKLVERVGYDASLNAEALLRLAGIILALYEGAERTLEDIKVLIML